jgi:hypothetical protein
VTGATKILIVERSFSDLVGQAKDILLEKLSANQLLLQH